MSRLSGSRRRPSVHITLQRAARLRELVELLKTAPRERSVVLSELRIGLRTFYRELELLKRCGVKVRYQTKLYRLLTAPELAEGLLPFPDPQLSFAEMAELACCDCPAGHRLADMLATVVHWPKPDKKKRARASRARANK